MTYEYYLRKRATKYNFVCVKTNGGRGYHLYRVRDKLYKPKSLYIVYKRATSKNTTIKSYSNIMIFYGTNPSNISITTLNSLHRNSTCRKHLEQHISFSIILLILSLLLLLLLLLTLSSPPALIETTL